MNAGGTLTEPDGYKTKEGDLIHSPIPAPFSLRETVVMGRLGLHDREEMRGLRGELLVEGEDYGLQGRVMMYSEAAAEKLARALGLAAVLVGARGVFAEGKAGEPIPPVQRVFLVASTRGKNPRVLMCVDKEEELNCPARWMPVSVRLNVNFIRGMRVLVEREERGWRFVGNPEGAVARLPRWRGRW